MLFYFPYFYFFILIFLLCSLFSLFRLLYSSVFFFIYCVVFVLLMIRLRLVFSNNSVLHLRYFKRLYLNCHEFLMYSYGSRQNYTIFTLLTGETLLKTPLTISVALENSRGERAKRF